MASTNGDYARAATMVGMSADEVKAELAALIRQNGSVQDGQPAKAASGAAESSRKAPAGIASAKSKQRKR
jgi:hypothetical protein